MPKSTDKAHTIDDGMFWQKVRKVMGKLPLFVDPREALNDGKVP